MAVAFRSSTVHATGGTGTTAILNKPAGLANNDILLLALLVRLGAGAPTVTAPDGTWTQIRNDTFNAAASRLITFWKPIPNAAGEPASYTFTLSVAGHRAGGLAAFSGADNTTPIDVAASGQLTTAGTTIVAPAVTPTSANVLLLGVFAVAAPATLEAITAPGSMLERWEDDEPSGQFNAVDLCDETYNNPGVSTGTRTATCSVAGLEQWGRLIPLRPASGPAAVLPPLPVVVDSAVSRAANY